MVDPRLDNHWPYYGSSLMIIAYMYLAEFHRSYFTILILFFTVLPIVDQILPFDELNPTKEEEAILAKQKKWQIPIFSYVFWQWAALFWGLNFVQRVEMTNLELFAFVYSIGLITTFGFVFSHELLHRRDPLSKAVATLSLLNALYMHFYTEHIYGHHKHVATPLDPATASYGQNVYSFLY